MAEITYQKLKQFYIDNKVDFQEREHAPGASAEDYHTALGCRYEQQLKCLLVKVYGPDKDQFVMVTIAAQKRADFEKIKQMLNAKKVRGATLDELRQVTGCEYGEVPKSITLVGVRGIEPPTSGPPALRSATELHPEISKQLYNKLSLLV